MANKKSIEEEIEEERSKVPLKSDLLFQLVGCTQYLRPPPPPPPCVRVVV